jgi:NAD+ synthase
VTELPALDVELLARALESFLVEELRASGLSRYVVGLSGGVDSAASTALAVAAVGAERVTALALPGPTSSPASRADAEAVAASLGIELDTVDLTAAGQALAAAFGAATDRVRYGNVMARLRMAALFDRARASQGLVLGTSNKSEILLGYSTLFGDIASSANPLGDVWKTRVFALAERLGLPRAVIDKPPTADLWEGQTDAGELGFDYRDADPVLYLHHERHLDRGALLDAGFAPTLVDAVLHAYRRSRFKWRPTVVARISTSCVNIDRILPRNPER